MTRRFAVIGAGAGGLCAAKHLAAAGIEPTIFEAGSRVGGLWVYDNDSGTSPAYKSLHINSESRVSCFADFPFPPGAALYPDHAEMAHYFAAYAAAFDLTRRIRFGCRVASVDPCDGGFAVTLASGETARFDGVVVATGHQSVPRHPPGLEAFTGRYLHAHAYRVPDPFAGKRVLVIGPGNSGVDIASDLCATTALTMLSARSPVLIMPRMMFGVPNARVFGVLERPWLPWPVRVWIRIQLTRIFHGTMEQWGFTTPRTRTHPISHPTLISNIAWGRIAIKPGIARVEGDTVHFTDGAAQPFDAIVAATGYETTIPFLADNLTPVEPGTTHLYLYNRVAHLRDANLYFIGFFDVTGGSNIRMMDDQAAYIAALASGAIRRPNELAMRAAIAAERAWAARQFPETPRYGLELDPKRYRRRLARDYARRQPAPHLHLSR